MNPVSQCADVRKFHAKHGFSIGDHLDELSATSETAVLCGEARGVLAMLANHLYTQYGQSEHLGDVRIARLALLCEELSELALALAMTDPVDALDAVLDISYLCAGTAVSFGWDDVYAAGWAEVHRANMSKDKGPGMKPIKGDAYTKPDIEGLLR